MTYREGPAPRPRVTLDLRERRPAKARWFSLVFAVLLLFGVVVFPGATTALTLDCHRRGEDDGECTLTTRSLLGTNVARVTLEELAHSQIVWDDDDGGLVIESTATPRRSFGPRDSAMAFEKSEAAAKIRAFAADPGAQDVHLERGRWWVPNGFALVWLTIVTAGAFGALRRRRFEVVIDPARDVFSATSTRWLVVPTTHSMALSSIVGTCASIVVVDADEDQYRIEIVALPQFASPTFAETSAKEAIERINEAVEAARTRA